MIQGADAKLPCLTIRGAQAKRLVPVLAHVVRQHKVEGVQQHLDILLALENSAEIDNILDRNSKAYKLPDLEADALIRNGFEFCQMVTKLVRHFHPLGKNYFHMTIKTHWFLHFCLTSTYINPLMGSCFSGEDFMKIIKRITVSCAAATGPEKANLKAMEKYVRGLALDLGGLYRV